MADLTSALAAAARRSIRNDETVYLVPTYGRGWVAATWDDAKMGTAGYIVVTHNVGTEYDGAGNRVRRAQIFTNEQLRSFLATEAEVWKAQRAVTGRAS